MFYVTFIWRLNFHLLYNHWSLFSNYNLYSSKNVFKQVSTWYPPFHMVLSILLHFMVISSFISLNIPNLTFVFYFPFLQLFLSCFFIVGNFYIPLTHPKYFCFLYHHHQVSSSPILCIVPSYSVTLLLPATLLKVPEYCYDNVILWSS